MSIVKGLLDRIIFAAGVVLFMQVPHLIDQYEQRLGGYHQAQIEHLEHYQQLADLRHEGSLAALAKKFELSPQQSVQQTGRFIRESEALSLQVEKQASVLATGTFVSKLSLLAVDMNLDIAQAVVQTYTPAFPLSLTSLLCGLVGGVLFSLLLNIFSLPLKLLSAGRQSERSQQSSTRRGQVDQRQAQHGVVKHRPIQQRIEPTIMRSRRAV